MFKIICANLVCRKKHYIGVFLELVLVMVVSCVVITDFMDWLAADAAYEALSLDRVLYYTMTGDDYSAQDCASMTEGTFLGTGYEQIIMDDVTWTPVTEAYLFCIPYTYKKKLDWESVPGLKAVVPKNLSGKYRLGESYTVFLDEQEVSFTVVGVLSGDWAYLPPTPESWYDVVSKKVILLFDDSVVPELFAETAAYTLWFSDQKELLAGADALADHPGLAELGTLGERNESRSKLELEVMGEPILIFFFIVLLAAAALVSHVLLTVVAFERRYGILYICGYTWGKCVLTQILADMVPAALALILSAAGIVIYAKGLSRLSWNGTALLVAAGVVLSLFVLSELLGGIRMRRKNPAEIVEAVYG